jgi:D-glycero-beta-D-manno-heptose-7-phosphate kinase
MNDIKTYHGIGKERLNEILCGISGLRAAVIGDISLDIYWRADMRKSELSRETPHFPLPVIQEWMSPGAGGNVASNLKALGTSQVYVVSAIGSDWRGGLLLSGLGSWDIRTEGIITSGDIVTNAYCKPLIKGISDLEYEGPRIDFANYMPLPPKDETKLLEALDHISGKVDVFCVTDQFLFGCITEKVRLRLAGYARSGKTVVADSRYRIKDYSDVYIKPNETEALRAAGITEDMMGASPKDLGRISGILSKRNVSGVCMTAGKQGCIYSDKEKTVHIPSYDIEGPIDTCGAGDAFLSAFACALAAGAAHEEAASLANIAADVTVKKLGTTGTACPEEIRKRHDEIFTGSGRRYHE